MMAFGLARVGRDVEVRLMPNGDSVADVSLAFAYGRKGDDGKRPVQWLSGNWFGKRAEALAQYDVKVAEYRITAALGQLAHSYNAQ